MHPSFKAEGKCRWCGYSILKMDTSDRWYYALWGRTDPRSKISGVNGYDCTGRTNKLLSERYHELELPLAKYVREVLSG